MQSQDFQFLHCSLSDWLEIGHVFVCEFRPPRASGAELWISDTYSQWNLGCNFKHFVAHQSKQSISWSWGCLFFIYPATSRLNSANTENVSAGLPTAYLPTFTSSSYLFGITCSRVVFPLTSEVCLAQQKNLLFCSLWYLAGKWKEHKEEKENCFFFFSWWFNTQVFFLVLLLLLC